jgi:hypothetical protein
MPAPRQARHAGRELGRCHWPQRLRSSLGGGTDVAADGQPSTSDTAPGVERAGMITGHAHSTITDPCKSPNMTTTSGSAS